MIPLKDNWKLPFSFTELWRNLNRMARLLNGMQLEGGQVIFNENGIRLSPGSSGTGSTDFAWNATGTTLDISITPGDIELGPDTVIAWGSITGAAATVSATTGDSYLYIWVNVDVSSETATMLSGTSITALDSTEKKTILQKKIAKVSFTADVVTFIARYQCGNIFIPRL